MLIKFFCQRPDGIAVHLEASSEEEVAWIENYIEVERLVAHLGFGHGPALLPQGKAAPQQQAEPPIALPDECGECGSYDIIFTQNKNGDDGARCEGCSAFAWLNEGRNGEMFWGKWVPGKPRQQQRGGRR